MKRRLTQVSERRIPEVRRSFVIATLTILLAACATPDGKGAPAAGDADDDAAALGVDAGPAPPICPLLAAPNTDCATAADCATPTLPAAGATVGAAAVSRCVNGTCTSGPSLWQLLSARPGDDGGDTGLGVTTPFGAPYGHHTRFGAGDGHAAALVSDGSLVVLGVSDYGPSETGADVDGRFVRVDSGGDVVVDRRLSFIGKEANAAITVAPNDVVFGSLTATKDFGAHVMKLSPCGDIAWSNLIMSPTAPHKTVDYSAPFHRIEALHADRTGGVVAAGWHNAEIENQWGSQGWFLQLNSAGKVVRDLDFSKHRYTDKDNVDSAFYGIAPGADGKGWLLAGHNSAKANCLANFDGWVVRIDDSGKLLWDRFFGGEHIDMVHHATAAPGGYVIVGRTFSKREAGGDPWLFRIDDTGQDKAPQWQTTLPWRRADQLNAVAVHGDTINAVGWSESYGAKRDGLIAQFDLASGELRWSRVLGHEGADRFDSVVVRPDGVVVAVGQTDHDASGGDDLWVRQLDAKGNRATGPGCADVSICDDDNPCTLDGCDPEAKACVYVAQAAGASCDDGQACTVASTCDGGVCTGGKPRHYPLTNSSVKDASLYGAVAWGDGSVLATGVRATQGGSEPVMIWRERDGSVRGKDLDGAGALLKELGAIGFGDVALHGRHEDHASAIVMYPVGKAPLWQEEVEGQQVIKGVVVRLLRYIVTETGFEVDLAQEGLQIASASDAKLHAIDLLPDREFVAVGWSRSAASKATHAFYGIIASGYDHPAVFAPDGGKSSLFVDVTRSEEVGGVAAGQLDTGVKAQGWLVGFAQKPGKWAAATRWSLPLPQMAIADELARAVQPYDPKRCAQGGALFVAGRSSVGVDGHLVLAKVALPGAATSTTPAAQLLWSRAIPSAPVAEIAGLQLRWVGGSVDELQVAGWHTTSAGQGRPFFHRFSPSGGVTALRTIETEATSVGPDARIRAAVQVGDDTMLFGRSQTKAGSPRTLMMRIDRWGNAACTASCQSAALVCDDGDPCTHDLCLASGGSCAYTPGNQPSSGKTCP